jgi:hypothetical protein
MNVIVVEAQPADHRRARVFFREFPTDLQAADSAVVARYWDDEDQEREPALRRILVQPNVGAVAYPTSGHRDVLQVFLKETGRDALVFACVLMSGARLRDMLARSSPIVEGFALQVLPGDHLSMEGIRAALQVWVERCFPDLVLPSLTVERWTGPEGIQHELLELLYAQPNPIQVVSRTFASGDDTPTELQPDPELAQPPYETAA